MRAFRVEDLPIESKMLTRALDEAQRKVENYFFDIRKQLFEYDEVLNSQRDRVYTERRRALESDSLQPLLIEYAELTMDDILEVIAIHLAQCWMKWLLVLDWVIYDISTDFSVISNIWQGKYCFRHSQGKLGPCEAHCKTAAVSGILHSLSCIILFQEYLKKGSSWKMLWCQFRALRSPF